MAEQSGKRYVAADERLRGSERAGRAMSLYEEGAADAGKEFGKVVRRSFNRAAGKAKGATGTSDLKRTFIEFFK